MGDIKNNAEFFGGPLDGHRQRLDIVFEYERNLAEKCRYVHRDASGRHVYVSREPLESNCSVLHMDYMGLAPA